ncbi:MAG: hypothetical protein AAB592_04100 [Patescibacteria group bacterium]
MTPRARKISLIILVVLIVSLITAVPIFAGQPLPKGFVVAELNLENWYVGLPSTLKVFFVPKKHELNGYYSGEMYLKLYGPRGKRLDSMHLNTYDPFSAPVNNKFFLRVRPTQRKFALYFNNPENGDSADLITLHLTTEYQESGASAISLFDREVNVYKGKISLPQ